MNQLIQFPISDIQAMEWAATIERIAPGIEPERIAFVLDCFACGRLDYDKSQGIQNIFYGLSRVFHDGEKYELTKIW